MSFKVQMRAIPRSVGSILLQRILHTEARRYCDKSIPSSEKGHFASDHH